MKKDRKKLYIRIFWALFLTPIILLTTLFVLIGNGVIGYIPDFSELENPENNLASVLITEDNEILGKYFVENRTFSDYDNLSPYLVNALVATEDIRFYRHSGVDARGLARVLIRTIIGGQDAGGGSTLSQQLAKNLYKTRREDRSKNSIVRSLELVVIKFSEWVTAARLERFYSKKEILLMYLNTVPFGHETYGIRSASRVFFNTSPDSLKLEQAAVLVGLLKAPTRYSPILNPDNSIGRRNVVLSQMAKYDFIDQEVKDSVSNLPLDVNYQAQSHISGLAPHFRTFLRMKLMAPKPEKENYYSYASFQEDSTQWEKDPLFGWANKNFKPDGSNYNIYTDGLRIYTTINFKMQEYAENAVTKHLGGQLQEEFFAEKENDRQAPFSEDLTREEISRIMSQAMARTDRYRRLRARGVSRDSILEEFNTPVEMSVFSWEGMVDTVMTPMDSLKYYKYFLRSGMMAMEPGTGHVKAYVGGHNFRFFMYDQVTQGRRQVGSTIKPFLYTLAMQEGFSPCDLVPNVPVTFIDHDSTYTPKN
ncbi:MAG: transglycosylase domain-containing protein, partial [Bacteroidales bacterium]